MQATEYTTDDQYPVDAPSVAVIVNTQEQLLPLLTTGLTTATMHNGTLTIFCVTLSDDEPTWFSLPDAYDSADIVQQRITGKNVINELLKELKQLRPMLLGMALDNKERDDRYLVGKAFEPILQQLNCPVYLIKSTADWTLPGSLSALVPFWNDENTRFAITTALELSPQLRITAAKVVPPTIDRDERQAQQEEFIEQTSTWKTNSRFQTKLLFSFDEQHALLEEAAHYGFLLTGFSKGNRFTRTLFGDFRNQLVNKTKGTAIILREYQGRAGTALFKGWSLFDRLLPTLTREDRIEAYRLIRRGGRPNRDFFSMIVFSAGIASLGLVLDSAAVIIGAMLIAPLMSAIIGMGMAIIHGDIRFLMLTGSASFRGAAIAVLTGFLFGLINFQGATTQQMLQRTDPSTLDLVVALISGVAAAYALCRKNVSNALPGVAIAVALVPPLATVGVCLSIGFWSLAWGAFKLFLSNMVAIVFASSLVFASFGFKPKVETTQDHRRITIFQRSFFASGILVLLMLGLLIIRATEDIQEAAFDDEVQIELVRYMEELDIQAEIDDWSIVTTKNGDFSIALQLESSQDIPPEKVAALEDKLENSLNKQVSLDLTVILVEKLHVD